MKKLETEVGVAEAVRFLTSRIAEQARDDSVSLTDLELKQLSFSEGTASAEEIAAANDFDVTNDSDKFEAKIVALLRSAFHHDVKRGMGETWREHLAALRDQDIYVLVMLDQAKIPRHKTSLVRAALFSTSPRKLFRTFPDAAAGFLTLCGFVYFFLLRMGWGRRGPPIFGNLAERLIPSDSVRGTLLVIWIGSMLWLWFRTKDA
jgi:hypothetical protein